MSVPPAAGGSFPDSTASRGAGLILWSNGQASKTVTTPAFRDLVLRARGDQCGGAPTAAVSVDGVLARTLTVAASAWTAYHLTGNWAAGSHSITISFNNDYYNGCDRNLRVDTMSFQDPSVTAEMERMAFTDGAGATYADRTASAGSALLLWSGGAATGAVTAPAGGQVVLRAKGELCQGAPHLAVTLDGSVLGAVSATGTAWTDLAVPGSWPGGTHQVAVSFDNDFTSPGCDRNVRMDTLTVRPGGSVVPPPVVPPTSGNPFAGARGYVDPNSDAKRAADARRSWDPAGAAALDKVASGSAPTWYGNWNPTEQLAGAVNDQVTRETAAGALPILIAYNIPYRDCGGYSGGGSATADAYRNWVRQMAAGIGNRRVAVILEPDAVAQLNDCLTDAQKSERLALLSGAVDTFNSHAGTSVYVDAGNPGWISTDTMGGWLRAAGIAKARGFALNVSNYASDSTNRAYGSELSGKVGGKPFVVDTSRNGQGPGTTWCNPAGRGLGQRWSVPASDPVVDAYTWLRGPGGSDGTCNGGPSAGTFWLDFAIGLGQRASL